MPQPSAAPSDALRDWFRRDIEGPLLGMVGGPERLKIVFLLACVLALDAADKATVGAVAAPLEQALHIGNVQIGLLVTASTLIGAFVTLPFGILADRTRRTRLLVASIGLWSLAMVVGGFATSYLMLLLSRLALGAIVAASGPAVMSLTGDYFHPGERGRIFGYILGGELIGVAFGFLISGNVAALLSWRASFWVLALLGFVLAAVIWRWLPEPARGGRGEVPEGATSDEDLGSGEGGSGSERVPEVERRIEQHGVEPRDALVLHEDPTNFSLWQSVRYILSIPTYRTLVIASALGYFYFTGLRTFAMVFMRGRFGLDQSTASLVSVAVGLGAIVGVLLAGRGGDRLIRRGRINGRVMVGAAAYLLAAVAFIPSFLISSLVIAAPLFFIAAAGIGGANPAVDAARLDVMHSRLWGRAEGVRSVIRYGFEALAPPLFGYVSSFFGGPVHGGAAAAGGAAAEAASAAAGLGDTFLVMLLPLALAGLILLRGLRVYPRDVATAIASEDATAR
ncbi:MAG TPA: MFS transporter [Rhodanobacteraceae bacterium]|nr:MFS transporter [Rhodanobacteraceae bacterium]